MRAAWYDHRGPARETLVVGEVADPEPGPGEVRIAVDRIAEVDFAAHVDLDAAVIAVGGVICSYSSSAERPEIPYWKLGFADSSVRFLGSDDFPAAVKAEAAEHLTAALVERRLRSTIAASVPLTEIVRAHELVEQGAPGRVIVELTAR